jgi:hypothetical protein
MKEKLIRESNRNREMPSMSPRTEDINTRSAASVKKRDKMPC